MFRMFDCTNVHIIYSYAMILMIYQYFNIDAIVLIYRYNEFSIVKYLNNIVGKYFNTFDQGLKPFLKPISETGINHFKLKPKQ